MEYTDIIYTWDNTNIEVHNSLVDSNEVTKDNVITSVQWKFTATHKTHIDPLTGELLFRMITSVIAFDKDSMDFADFKDYENITITDINNWILKEIGESGLNSLKSTLLLELESIIEPQSYWTVKEA